MSDTTKKAISLLRDLSRACAGSSKEIDQAVNTAVIWYRDVYSISPQPTDSSEEIYRAHWLGAPEFFHLDLLCRAVVEALNCTSVYLVGSSLERRDFRDVDIRAILRDEEFDRLFPEIADAAEGSWSRCAMWSFMCGAF